VGWFTSVYPVILDLRNKKDIPLVIKNTKDMLRNIPHKGIGYGILKYLTKKENKQTIEFRLNPEVGFNYHGQADGNLSNSLFQMANISSGNSISLNSERLYPLYITGVVFDKRLRMLVSYGREDFDDNDILCFVNGYEKRLQQIIDHCITREETELTASDFTSSIEAQEVEMAYDILNEITLQN
jgi:non-ribosomal peptide synthase protein (TIGR01720 family)